MNIRDCSDSVPASFVCTQCLSTWTVSKGDGIRVDEDGNIQCPECGGFRIDFYFRVKEETSNQKSMRTFDTGATRDGETGKLDYEGFFSPLALREYAEYMHKHRTQSDGKLRDSDNWQKGIPLDAYMKSAWRHHVDWWTMHRAAVGVCPEIKEAICGEIFNAMGYLHELVKYEKKESNE